MKMYMQTKFYIFSNFLSYILDSQKHTNSDLSDFILIYFSFNIQIILFDLNICIAFHAFCLKQLSWLQKVKCLIGMNRVIYNVNHANLIYAIPSRSTLNNLTKISKLSNADVFIQEDSELSKSTPLQFFLHCIKIF